MCIRDSFNTNDVSSVAKNHHAQDMRAFASLNAPPVSVQDGSDGGQAQGTPKRPSSEEAALRASDASGSVVSPSFAMQADSFVEFPRSTTSAGEAATMSAYDAKSGNPVFEYFSRAEAGEEKSKCESTPKLGRQQPNFATSSDASKTA